MSRPEKGRESRQRPAVGQLCRGEAISAANPPVNDNKSVSQSVQSVQSAECMVQGLTLSTREVNPKPPTDTAEGRPAWAVPVN